MRMRKKPNLIPRMDRCAQFLVSNPEAQRGSWRMLMPHAEELRLEIGCGKGAFIAAMAEKHKDSFFIAVEGNRSVLLRAMEKIRDRNLKNVIFIPSFVEDLREWFGPAEVEKIFLNFSDPWHKPS